MRERSHWADRLGEEKQFLLAMVRGIESEFLETGRGLSRMAKQLHEIQRLCEPLIDVTLAERQSEAVQFAFRLLQRAEDLVLASYDQYDCVFATFRELQGRLVRLGAQHEALMRVLFPLNLITIAFRIEASQHPSGVQQAFLTLASNVKRAVSEVRCTMERQFGDLAASERTARALLDQVAGSIALHRKQVSEVLAENRQHLSELKAALTRSGEAAADLARLNVAVTRHMGAIIMAQQCQDITRQSIEHIGEAMDDMVGHLHAPDDAGTADSPGEQVGPYIYHAAQIQLQQARKVYAEIDGAAQGLRMGMHSLQDEAGVAASAAIQVGETSKVAGVASQCQAGIGEILKIVRLSVQKIADILAALEPLRDRFINCGEKGTELAIDVRYAALNAQVFAIQAPDGAALEVLSGRVRAISDEAIQHVERMSSELHETIGLVNHLRQRLEDFQQLGQAEEETLANGLIISQEKLSGLEGSLPLSIHRIPPSQEAFRKAVELVLANIHFPETVSAASTRTLRFLEEIALWADENHTITDLMTSTAEKIDRLKARYTMDSERNAHHAATGDTVAVAGQNSTTVPSPAADDSLGDNIELF